MRYAHLKREQVLHNDRTEIVPNPEHLRVVLHSMLAGPVQRLTMMHRNPRVLTLPRNCWELAVLVN